MFFPAKKYILKIRRVLNTRFLARRSAADFIIDNTKDKQFDLVVDIGAGKAPYKKYIKCKRYIAVDCEDRGGADKDLIIADANKKLPLDDGIADLVIATEVLEHIKEPAILVSEIFRILKEGGMALLTTPFVWPVHEAPNDYFRFTSFGLDYLFKKAGFGQIQLQTSGCCLSAITQLVCLELKRKIFSPLVIIINFLRLLFFKIERSENNKDSNIYSQNHVIAKK